nr:hypothetical protein [Tanacetum cinerariifolium]
MDHYTMKALWIYWIKGNGEVELTNEECFVDMDEVTETKPTPVKHTCKPFNYKTGCSKWPTYSWKDDGYCNGGNLPGTYIIGNQLHYQDYEWYEALEDSELKYEALRNKSIIEGSLKHEDESRYEPKKRWNIYTNYDGAYEINHDDNTREELCEVHELLVCNVRRYKMIKYSFNNYEEYVAIKEDKYDDLTIIKEEACRAYQEIYLIMDEGWMDEVPPKSKNDMPLRDKYSLVKMIKVIKGEFEKIKDVKVKDVSLSCDTSLKVFKNEVCRLSRIDDDLFTYEVEVANIPCDSKMDDALEHEADDDT